MAYREKSADPSGSATSVLVEKDGDRWNIQHSQDVSAIINDAAKSRQQFEDAGGFRATDGLQRVVSFPEPVAVMLKEKYGINVLTPGKLTAKQRRFALNFMRRNYPKLMHVDPGKRW